ncbi:unnamed protein product [Allacma fusca]|uniref:Uncharacterized protein n=1 Tax=Allacma fusca TaxID=39272 RepID=A0A8J2NZV9_9HEXA|nr:unnamed protein product [Allacma fusca]
MTQSHSISRKKAQESSRPVQNNLIAIEHLSFDERNKKKWPVALSQTEDNLSSLLLNPGPQTWIWDCGHSSSTWLVMGGKNCVPNLRGRDSNQ